MIIFFNGIIHTMDAARPRASAMVVNSQTGKIELVGRLEQFPTFEPGTQIIDLGGRTMIPGFNDAHVHIWQLGLLLTVQVDARAHVAPDLPALINQFRARAAETPPGQWITGRGYNEVTLAEGRHPTRADLDAASTDHPLAVRRTCGHMLVANSRALELAGITAQTPAPPGGVIDRDADGEPTGLIKETAMGLINRVVPPLDDETVGHAIREATFHQLRLGITSATDPMIEPDQMRVYRKLDADADLALRVNGLAMRWADGASAPYPLPERYIGEMLRIDGVKFFADGGLSGATAAIGQPYKGSTDQGVLRFETDTLRELMWEAHTADYRIGVHAIGAAAIEQVLTIYEDILHQRPQPELRHRIEHLGLPTADQLRRCAALGIIAVPQTVFLPALGASFRRYLPDALLANCYPVRSMLDAGLTVALSTDAPVVPDDNPLLGIKAALDRRGPDGAPIAPDQAITVGEALYAYTMGGAIASGDAGTVGSITPGKWADLVVLSADPLAAEYSDVLLDIHVDQTYIGGRLVYER
ncbi:MAG: amidohydrolase [Chloroflexi bacterium]|nr:amidohydrolase [Chloroflexota bacterium]